MNLEFHSVLNKSKAQIAYVFAMRSSLLWYIAEKSVNWNQDIRLPAYVLNSNVHLFLHSTSIMCCAVYSWSLELLPWELLIRRWYGHIVHPIGEDRLNRMLNLSSGQTSSQKHVATLQTSHSNTYHVCNYSSRSLTYQCILSHRV